MNFLFPYLQNYERVQLANTCSWLNEVHNETPLAEGSFFQQVPSVIPVVKLRLDTVKAKDLRLPWTRTLELVDCEIQSLYAPKLNTVTSNRLVSFSHRVRHVFFNGCGLSEKRLTIDAENIYCHHCVARRLQTKAKLFIFANCLYCGPGQVSFAEQITVHNDYISKDLLVPTDTKRLAFHKCTFQDEPRYPSMLTEFRNIACNAILNDFNRLPFQHLRVLDLTDNFTLKEMPWIPKALEELWIWHTGIHKFDFLSGLRNLRVLGITVRKISDMDFVPETLNLLGLCLKESRITLERFQRVKKIKIHMIMPYQGFRKQVPTTQCCIRHCSCISNS
jgi:hypothetical protein